MRKLILLLAALALAALPSTADAARKGKKRAAAPPPAQQQLAPGESGARVIGGFFREVGKIGQPVQPAAKGRKAKRG
jgi:hypothetical protein